VDPQELAAWVARDPIDHLKQKLLAERRLSAADFDGMQQRVQAMVAKGVEFARSSPFPDAAELITDVYA
jgi:TPP-dependent pyruvate/acetoin dehydrogenase alpha subunit